MGLAQMLAGPLGLCAATDPYLALSSLTIVSNQVQVTLTGEANVSYVIESSPDSQNWNSLMTNTAPEITRLITLDTPTNEMTFYRAWREPLPAFTGALIAKSNITFNGTYLTVDSYDSGDTNYSTTNGLYDPARRKAGGDVSSAEGLINAGNATIKGMLRTGMTTNYSIGPYGSVGDLNWPGPGIQPGWYRDDFRFVVPDVAAPYEIGLPPIGDATNLWHLGSWPYMYSGNFSANSSKTIYVSGNATLYVAGTFDCKGKIIIAPGASLRLYVGGAFTRLNEVLTDGPSTSFQYFGLPTNVAVSWAGNDDYVGTICAPQAIVKIGGGGATTLDFQGSCVANAIALNGTFNFHFDENLKRIGPMR